MKDVVSVTVAWEALPEYAARSLAAAAERTQIRLTVVTTESGPALPYLLRKALNPIRINREERLRWSDLGLHLPDVFVCTGWRNRAFRELAHQARRQRTFVVGMVDNIPRNNMRQRIGGVVFRLLLRRLFDGFLVPGQAAMSLLESYGVAPNAIRCGMYAASPRVFKANHDPARASARRVLFVGQLIERKAVDVLVEAFRVVRERVPDAQLRLVGNGPLSDVAVPGVVVAPFSDSTTIASLMSQCTVFVLPSRLEHWGVVVHEAALCGSPLVVSHMVGSRHELVSSENGRVVNAGDVGDLASALEDMLQLGRDSWFRMSRMSAEKAMRITPEDWVVSVLDLYRSSRGA